MNSEPEPSIDSPLLSDSLHECVSSSDALQLHTIGIQISNLGLNYCSLEPRVGSGLYPGFIARHICKINIYFRYSLLFGF